MLLDQDLHAVVEEVRERGRRPRVHPNGFIQLDLEEPEESARGHSGAVRRLHVWPEEGAIQAQESDNSVHDHVFDMHSTVLRGELEQVLYWPNLAHGGQPTHEVYVARYSRASASTLAPSGVLAHCVISSTHRVRAGADYWQPAFSFHDTQACERPLVTVMDKRRVFEGDARVLVPVGQQPDNSFDRLLESEDDLWSILLESVS